MIYTANIINTEDTLFEIYRVFKESTFEGIDSEKIKEFYSTCNLIASKPENEVDFSNSLETIIFYFNNSKDSSISSSSPIMKAIFYVYAENIGNPLTSSELFKLASNKLSKVSIKDIETEFDDVIGKLVFGAYVKLFAIKPKAVSNISKKPKASENARYQAKNANLNRLFVTNKINEMFLLQIHEKYILELLDGSRDIKKISEEILEKFTSGEIIASNSGSNVTDKVALEILARQCVDVALDKFRVNYLLVG